MEVVHGVLREEVLDEQDEREDGCVEVAFPVVGFGVSQPVEEEPEKNRREQLDHVAQKKQTTASVEVFGNGSHNYPEHPFWFRLVDVVEEILFEVFVG